MATPGSGTIGYRPPTLTGLADLLDEQVRERPGAPALMLAEGRVRLSYGALDTLVGDVATRLRQLGLRPGDLLALMGSNSAEFVVGLLGAARAGVVVAPVDPSLPDSETSARLTALGAKAVITPSRGSVAVPAVAGTPPTWGLSVDVHGAAARVTLDADAPASADVRGAACALTDRDALVLLTAGTTGGPKMVPLTQANVAASVRGICATYEFSHEDATVAAMPFFHGHGLLATLLSSLASGGCVLLPAKGRFSARTFWDDVASVAATWFTAVPTILEILLERVATDPAGARAASLRFVRTCSAPLNAATGQELTRILGVPLLSAYGITETTHQATGEPLPSNGPRKPGSVGPGTGVVLRVVASDGSTCSPGTVGEVWVHGPTVTRGYLTAPAELTQSVTDGWFHTGDLGSVDEDGYLFLSGRIKSRINRGGEKISPEYVEEVISGYPGVAEVAVFPVPDSIYGQRVGAAVVLRAGATVTGDEIRAYAGNRLSAFEVPDRVDVVEELPHSAKGSLDRKALVERFGL